MSTTQSPRPQLCWWPSIIPWILILQRTQLRHRADMIHTIGFVEMYLSHCCSNCSLDHFSHDDSKPFVNKTADTQDRTTHRKQLEHGSHSDSLRRAHQPIEISLPAHPKIQPRTCRSQNCPPWKNQVSPCMATHGMQLQNPPKTRCCLTVPESGLNSASIMIH